MSALENEMETERFTKELTVSIVGKSSVGKSTWINSIINKTFTESKRTTRGKNHKTFRITIDQEEFVIHSRDFGGQREYLNLVKTHGADGVDVIFLTYDLNDDDTFFELYEYIPQGLEKLNIPLYLVGLKNDLEKKVKDEEIASFMSTNKITSAFKLSSKSLENILDPFKKALSYYYDINDLEISEVEFDRKNSREKRIACRAEGCGKIHTIILSDNDIEKAKKSDNTKNEFLKKIIICHGKSKQFNNKDHQIIIKIDSNLDERPIVVEALPEESSSTLGLDESVDPLPTEIVFAVPEEELIKFANPSLEKTKLIVRDLMGVNDVDQLHQFWTNLISDVKNKDPGLINLVTNKQTKLTRPMVMALGEMIFNMLYQMFEFNLKDMNIRSKAFELSLSLPDIKWCITFYLLRHLEFKVENIAEFEPVFYSS